MKKKQLSIGIILSLSLLMASCGAVDKPHDAKGAQSVTGNGFGNVITSQRSEEEFVNPQNLQVFFDTVSGYGKSKDRKAVLTETDYQVPYMFTCTDEVKAAMKEVKALIVDNRDAAYAELEKAAESDYAITKNSNGTSDLPYESHMTMSVKRCDTNVISLLFTSRDTEIDKKETITYVSVNLDGESGRFLELSDVTGNADGFEKLVLKKIENIYGAEISDALSETVGKMIGGSEEERSEAVFTADFGGISLYIPLKGQLETAETAGLDYITVNILYAESPEIFTGQFKYEPKSYGIGVDLYGQNVLFGTESAKEYLKGGERCYLLKTADERYYLYIDHVMTKEGDESLDVYAVNEGTLSYINSFNGSFRDMPPTNPENFSIYDHGNVEIFCIGEDGMPVSLQQ